MVIAIKRETIEYRGDSHALPKPTTFRDGDYYFPIPAGSTFYETDTGRNYGYDGNAWSIVSENITGDSSYTIYLAGTVVKARRNSDGTIPYSGDNTVDAGPTIANAAKNIPGATTTGYGGTINIMRGDYKIVSEIKVDYTETGYEAVEFRGEGKATRLRFIPSSGLTNGFLIGMPRPAFKDLTIYGNSNVTNLIQVARNGFSPRLDYGIIQNVQLDGNPATATTYGGGGIGAIVLTQKGLYVQGTTTAPFFWKITNVDCRGLGIGMDFYDQMATSSMQTGITTNDCDIGIRLSGGQHHISNIWTQGESDGGRFGIYIDNIGTGQGGMTKISNLMAELFKTATECAAVYEAGATGNVECVNVQNGYADDKYWFHVLDRSGATTRVILITHIRLTFYINLNSDTDSGLQDTLHLEKKKEYY